MDIVLKTETENPYLKLEAVERYSDGSGYACNLEVKSDWIEARFRFEFESAPMASFISDLEKLDRTLDGSARLQPMWEPQFIALEGNGLGGILVRGLLIEYSPFSQEVKFAFETDQTCLRPLIAALKRAQTL